MFLIILKKKIYFRNSHYIVCLHGFNIHALKFVLNNFSIMSPSSDKYIGYRRQSIALTSRHPTPSQ